MGSKEDEVKESGLFESAYGERRETVKWKFGIPIAYFLPGS